jgi:TolB-like protein/class 3 adenylate cyclase/Tfp pilus assembly protein PilF
LEIAHVLFIDIVGYSKLRINEQSEQIQKLREIARGTEQFRSAEAEGKLLRLPTGDGGALVFRNNPEAPVLCALEIAKALKDHPELRVRMGIHSGPVNEVTDLNEQANIAGAGINIAQRIMDCGDAGHILVSKHAAEDLEQYDQWQPYLHDLGQCEVKHGERLHVVNLYTGELGNPSRPTKFKKPSRSGGVAVERNKLSPVVIVILSLVALAIVSVIFAPAILHSPRRRQSQTELHPNSVLAVPVTEKSIAVLPFENLSRDPDNAYFADGIQDEILTRLAKVADLKVISRTSTQRFKSAPSDLREIAKQLGVMNILEGSVQKSNDQVRVNVQLINALTDAHLWADIYDRKLTDIFTVESDIAKTIADTLQAKITGSEKSLIAKTPTTNKEAYELYLKGRFFWNKRTGADLRKAIDYFNQAIAKDPNYALAYAGLADSYLLLSPYGAAAPKDSVPQAKAAVKKALELDDTLAEAHASSGRIISGYDFDSQRAIAEFERALQLNPNYATARHWFAAGPLLALARFDQSIAQAKRSIELDPLSLINNADFGQDYCFARRYDEAIAQLHKTIDMESHFYLAHYYLGETLQLKGQMAEAIAEYSKAVELDDDPFALALLGQAYARAGRRDEANKILAQLNQEAKARYVSAYGVGLVFLGLGDKNRAMDELERAYRENDGGNIYNIKIDPMLDDLRGTPRFEALAEKIVPARLFKSTTASK